MNDLMQQRADAATLFINGGDDRTDLVAVAEGDLAARGIDEEFLREIFQERAAVGGELRLHFADVFESASVGPFAARIHGGAEAEPLSRLAPGTRVLVQVDTTEKEGRNGVPVDHVTEFLEQLKGLPLTVDGLMTVAPEDRAAAIACFHTVADLARSASLPVVSMGMSGDLSDAIAAGSTMIRVGSALFGPRGEKRPATQG